MFWIFVAFLLFAIAWAVKPSPKDNLQMPTLHVMASWLTAIAGLGCLFFGVYTNFLLPSYMNDFYNNGAGVTYQNPTNTTATITVFGNEDEQVLYFIIEQQSMISILAMMRDAFIYIIGGFMVIYGLLWAWEHNVYGEIVETRRILR